ncbi:hypothetical protein OAN94_02585 [Verrucomicrobiales bacterium]|jgi:hypothetical protein|nr:hypothetical protein [Verrucomicrobiales bacterium]MDC0503137.1 hypothetical protein [Verrucomicrobiales bacterium]
MPRYPLDVCWIVQTPSAPFSEDLSTIRYLAQTAPFNFGLAVVHEEALSSVPDIGASNLEIVTLQHSQPSLPNPWD